MCCNARRQIQAEARVERLLALVAEKDRARDAEAELDRLTAKVAELEMVCARLSPQATRRGESAIPK